MAIGPTLPCRLGSRKGLRALDTGCIEEFSPLNQSETYHVSFVYICRLSVDFREEKHFPEAKIGHILWKPMKADDSIMLGKASNQ